MATRAKEEKTRKEPLRQLADGRWRFRIYTFGSKKGPRRLFTLPRGFTRIQATARYRAELAKASARAGRPLPRGFTLAEVAPDYLRFLKDRAAAATTIQNVERLFTHHLIPAFGDRRIDTLGPADVESWGARMAEKGYAPGTINLGSKLLRAVLRRCVSWGWLDRDPLPAHSFRPRPGTGEKTDFLRPDEWETFVTALDDELRWEAYGRMVRCAPQRLNPIVYRETLRAALPVFRAILFTACRAGEVVALQWKDVDLEAGTVSVPMAKVKKVKLIPMAPDLREVLEARPRGTPGALVFAQPDGRPWDVKLLRQRFDAIRRLAGLRKGLSPHSLRHSAASWMVAAGMPLVAVRDALGHSSVAQTARYSHLDLSSLREAFDVLGAVQKSARRQSGATTRPSVVPFRSMP